MEELDSLMSSGKTCEESECSIDDVDDLIGELLDQQKELYNRVKQLKDEIKMLEKLNEGDRDVDEIQETVRAIVRIFQLGVSISFRFYGIFHLMFGICRVSILTISLFSIHSSINAGQGQRKRLPSSKQAHWIQW